MHLLLLRHGIAADLGEPGVASDAARPLTDKGRRRVRSAARGLIALEVRPDLVLCSPLVRAVQTAEELLAVLGPAPLRQTSVLEPGQPPEELFALLAATEAQQVLCVGHAPNLDRVLSAALGVPRATLSALGKAGAALLALGGDLRPPARLEWLLTPRALRRVGRRA